MIYANFSLN